jgi:hypothetical protein
LSDGVNGPVIAGLALGIALLVLFAIVPIPQYPLFSDNISYQRQQRADYTPLLKLQIMGLRDSYKVGEGIDFAVRQTAGGSCVAPELIIIKDLETGTIVKEWNGTKQSAMLLGCPFESNPATSGMTWSTRGFEENPILFNKTGSYAVIAKHLFKTAQKQFTVIAISDGEKHDTSPETIARLSSIAENMHIVKALLDKYPSANSTVTANYNSMLFQEFQKFQPHAIVQYYVGETAQHEAIDASNKGGGRQLLITIIFDRYYEYNTALLTIVQCTDKNYSSLSVSELPIGISEIEKC